MKINVCVNGTFRYPQYIRHYAEAGVLGRFFFAHRRSSTATLGLESEAAVNVWAKEYLLQASCRGLPAPLAKHAEQPICDLWQHAVIRSWRECESVEAVIGAVADKVLDHAKRGGATTMGHAVCAHPNTVAAEVGRAFADVGLSPAIAVPSGLSRRQAEIDCCDRLLVDSAAVARSYEAAGIGRERITVVSPAVDRTRFRPRTADDRDRAIFRVVCVGTVTPRKGQHYLLQAWGRLALRPAELLLIGPPGPGASAVMRSAGERAAYRRRVPNASLRALLVKASVLVLPSVEDGFGQAAVEAMACGVPVIVTAAVGMSDLVTDGHDGFVVPAFDADRIATCLQALFDDPARAEAMGRAAAASITGYGSWDTYVGRVLDLHRALVGQAGRQRRSAAA